MILNETNKALTINIGCISFIKRTYFKKLQNHKQLNHKLHITEASIMLCLICLMLVHLNIASDYVRFIKNTLMGINNIFNNVNRMNSSFIKVVNESANSSSFTTFAICCKVSVLRETRWFKFRNDVRSFDNLKKNHLFTTQPIFTKKKYKTLIFKFMVQHCI